jgi:hypothetical protein
MLHRRPDLSPNTQSTGNDWRQRFRADFIALVTRLNNLLGSQGTVGMPMSDWIRGAHESVENGDDKTAAFLLLSLGDLVEDLALVQQNDAEIFQQYRRRLKTVDGDAYRALRFEIGTAAAFIRHTIRYQAAQNSRSAPDFSVRCPEGRCDVECAVCVTSQAEAADLLHDIQSVVARKAKKKYAGPDTILFVEVVHGAYGHPEPESVEYNLDLREEVTRLIEAAGIGAAVVFKYVLTGTGDGGWLYRRAYLRCDGSGIGEQAAWLLDSYFPSGDLDVPLRNTAPFMS